LLATNANSTYVSLYKQQRYNFPDDFVPISLLVTTPLVLVVNPSLGLNSVKDVIDRAKAQPGQLLYGSGGLGSGPHLAAELFNTMAGVKVTHVPYKGTSDAVTDLIAGRISMMFSSMAIVRGFVEDGRLKVLGVTTEKKSASAPDLPTIAESGVPGYGIAIWWGLMAPKGTSPAVVDALSKAVEAAQRSPELKKRLEASGGEMISATPEEFGQFIAKDIQKWAKAVEHSGVKMD
jgi:tripartite-type tricarboxylate transporter receptor subunit TctC